LATPTWPLPRESCVFMGACHRGKKGKEGKNGKKGKEGKEGKSLESVADL